MTRLMLLLPFAVLLAIPATAVAQIRILGGLTTREKAKETKPKTDLDTLATAGLKPDDAAALLNYFKQRTLTDDQLTSINSVIRKMGSDDFEARQQASDLVLQFGPAAIGPLRKAIATDPDPEIVFRAEEARKKIEKVSQASIAIAAGRALAKLNHADAAKAILAFLPLADNQVVIDELKQSLVTLAVRDGKPEPALLAALTDSLTVRRSAAALALLAGGDPKERIRIPAALPQVKAMIAKETDAETKFEAVLSMLTIVKDRDSVNDLIGLIPDVGRGRIWQIEDFLNQLAGANAPKIKWGKGKETLSIARDGWKTWWQSAKVDWDTFTYRPRTEGSLLIVEWNQNGYGQGTVTLLGPNLKERAKLMNLGQPIDAVCLPGQRIAVAEQSVSRVTIRNYNGDVLKTIQINQPMGLQLLSNGNLMIPLRNGVVEYDLDGKKIWSYDRPNNMHDVNTARRLKNGDTLLFTNSDQQKNCVRIDKNGKDVGKPFQLGQPYYSPAVDVINDNEIYITDYNKLTRYDLTTNKAGWTYNSNGITSVQTLPNGNLLLVSQTTNKIVELNAEKEEVWDYQVTNGMRLARAYRQ